MSRSATVSAAAALRTRVDSALSVPAVLDREYARVLQQWSRQQQVEDIPRAWHDLLSLLQHSPACVTEHVCSLVHASAHRERVQSPDSAARQLLAALASRNVAGSAARRAVLLAVVRTLRFSSNSSDDSASAMLVSAVGHVPEDDSVVDAVDQLVAETTASPGALARVLAYAAFDASRPALLLRITTALPRHHCDAVLAAALPALPAAMRADVLRRLPVAASLPLCIELLADPHAQAARAPALRMLSLRLLPHSRACVSAALALLLAQSPEADAGEAAAVLCFLDGALGATEVAASALLPLLSLLTLPRHSSRARALLASADAPAQPGGSGDAAAAATPMACLHSVVQHAELHPDPGPRIRPSALPAVLMQLAARAASQEAGVSALCAAVPGIVRTHRSTARALLPLLLRLLSAPGCRNSPSARLRLLATLPSLAVARPAPVVRAVYRVCRAPGLADLRLILLAKVLQHAPAAGADHLIAEAYAALDQPARHVALAAALLHCADLCPDLQPVLAALLSCTRSDAARVLCVRALRGLAVAFPRVYLDVLQPLGLVQRVEPPELFAAVCDLLGNASGLVETCQAGEAAHQAAVEAAVAAGDADASTIAPDEALQQLQLIVQRCVGVLLQGVRSTHPLVRAAAWSALADFPAQAIAPEQGASVLLLVDALQTETDTTVRDAVVRAVCVLASYEADTSRRYLSVASALAGSRTAGNAAAAVDTAIESLLGLYASAATDLPALHGALGTAVMLARGQRPVHELLRDRDAFHRTDTVSPLWVAPRAVVMFLRSQLPSKRPAVDQLVQQIQQQADANLPVAVRATLALAAACDTLAALDALVDMLSGRVRLPSAVCAAAASALAWLSLEGIQAPRRAIDALAASLQSADADVVAAADLALGRTAARTAGLLYRYGRRQDVVAVAEALQQVHERAPAAVMLHASMTRIWAEQGDTQAIRRTLADLAAHHPAVLSTVLPLALRVGVAAADSVAAHLAHAEAHDRVAAAALLHALDAAGAAAPGALATAVTAELAADPADPYVLANLYGAALGVPPPPTQPGALRLLTCVSAEPLVLLRRMMAESAVPPSTARRAAVALGLLCAPGERGDGNGDGDGDGDDGGDGEGGQGGGSALRANLDHLPSHSVLRRVFDIAVSGDADASAAALRVLQQTSRLPAINWAPLLTRVWAHVPDARNVCVAVAQRVACWSVASKHRWFAQPGVAVAPGLLAAMPRDLATAAVRSVRDPVDLLAILRAGIASDAVACVLADLPEPQPGTDAAVAFAHCLLLEASADVLAHRLPSLSPWLASWLAGRSAPGVTVAVQRSRFISDHNLSLPQLLSLQAALLAAPQAMWPLSRLRQVLVDSLDSVMLLAELGQVHRALQWIAAFASAAAPMLPVASPDDAAVAQMLELPHLQLLSLALPELAERLDARDDVTRRLHRLIERCPDLVPVLVTALQAMHAWQHDMPAGVGMQAFARLVSAVQQ